MKKRYFFAFGSLLAIAICCLTIPTCRVAARMVRYNFADIGDYQIFANRPLTHAATPFRFVAANSARQFAFPTGIFDTEKYKDIDDFLAKNKTVAFLVIKNDTICYEKYFNDYDQASIVPSFSMAKSFTSALIGCAIADGYIASENDPVTKYLPEMAANGYDKVTIKNVLQMTSGMAFNESYMNPMGEAAVFYYGDNVAEATTHLRLCREPGTAWEYVSGNTELLGVLLTRVLAHTPHKNVTNYLQTKIWSPLGMEYDASWSTDHEGGTEKTFCCLNARARDFAKFGRLYLHGGNWQGQQLIDSAWVAKANTLDTTAGGSVGYQYQWWLPSRRGDFTARGLLGQYIYINPSNKVVIVRLGSNKGEVDWLHWLSSWSQKI